MHREQFKEQAILISFLAVLGLTFWIFARMMMPFALALFVGGVLALLFKPAYEKLSEKRLNKYLAASIIALFFVILILGPMTAFTILAIKQGSALFQDLAGRETLSIQKLMTYLYTLPFVEDVLGSAEQLTLTIEQSLKSLAKEGSTQALGGLAQVPFGIIQILLALLSFFFFLIDGEDLVDWVFEKLPLQPAVETRVKEAFQNIAVSIVWATLVAALVQALLILIAFSIFKMPGPFFAAGATFIFAWIPFVGAFPVWATAVIYFYSQDQMVTAVSMTLVGVFISFSDNLIRPLVIKGRDNMHPFLALIAIFGGVKLFGFFGVFVGPIVAAMLVALLELWPHIGGQLGIQFYNRKRTRKP